MGYPLRVMLLCTWITCLFIVGVEAQFSKRRPHKGRFTSRSSRIIMSFFYILGKPFLNHWGKKLFPLEKGQRSENKYHLIITWKFSSLSRASGQVLRLISNTTAHYFMREAAFILALHIRISTIYIWYEFSANNMPHCRWQIASLVSLVSSGAGKQWRAVNPSSLTTKIP